MNKTLLTLSAFMLGIAAISLPVHADNSMAGMDMGGKPMAQKPAVAPAPKSFSVSATLNPAAPQTGDNTLNLMVTDGAGKPVTGLKLTTSVAMTSMDMGTTHPAFTETSNGHYTVKVSFGMDGPWRVVVRSLTGKVAVLDFNAGSKTPWKSPQIKATSPATSTPPAASSTPATPAANTMPGMDMSGGKTMDNKTDSTKSDNAKADQSGMAGMDMSGTAAKSADKADVGMGGMDMGDAKSMKMTGIGDMKTATIPELKETGTYTANGDENWKMQTGFGHNAPMVGMMNQMMVGGSGAEGMKMAPMDMKFGDANYTKPDASDAGDSMAGMDMGKATDAGKSSDMKSGDMKGMKMDAPPASGAPVPSAPVNITATTTSAPKSGDNPLTITVTDAQGKPVTGLKLTTSVAMTSMDMGTTHPSVTEKGSGSYTTTATFSMAGPWRVQVKVTPPGQKPQTKAFDFTAK